MKTLKQFMKEETMPYAGVRSGGMNIEDSAVRDNINALLAGMTNGKFVTPYIGLERVAKTLANFHIFMPAQSFLEGDSGTVIVPIEQYGIKVGMNNASTFIKKGEVGKDFTHGPHVEGEDNELSDNSGNTLKYTIFFEYRMSDCGMFMVFCEVVDEEELDEILADLEAELNDDTEELEEETINEVSPELVGTIANRRFRQETGLDEPPKRPQTSAAAKTLARAAKKKWLGSNVGVLKTP